ncbi:hypothetical protein LAV77_27155 [Priestia megaterium]|uniref:hypothetical protein n=1 Tax=Priestia megaterium TaxID=1404 RepID=UPI002B248448|nr:hypothetical protein [Priestia megaterium]MEB2268451.1 hypothetical protein [Priestia megaterium]
MTVTISKQNVTSNTTLLTMGENTRVEDVNLILTSTNHLNLTGVAFPGTTSQTAKLRTATITIDNSTASANGTSNVYGIHSFGTAVPTDSTSAIRAITTTVNSIGLGIKRALLVDTNTHNFYCRDINLVVNRTSGSGTFIGAEVNQNGAQLGLRLASIQGATADISQTSGVITIGSTNLINSNANSLGFSPLLQTPIIIWSDPGRLPTTSTRFYRPGTASVSTTEVFIRLSQKCIIKSLSIRSLTGPGGSVTDTWVVRKNGVNTPLTISLTGTQTSNINNNNSVTFQAGDSLSVAVLTGGNTGTTDSVVQVDIY